MAAAYDGRKSGSSVVNHHQPSYWEALAWQPWPWVPILLYPGKASQQPLPSLPPTGIIGSAYSITHNPADSALEAVARVGRLTFTAGERVSCRQ